MPATNTPNTVTEFESTLPTGGDVCPREFRLSVHTDGLTILTLTLPGKGAEGGAGALMTVDELVDLQYLVTQAMIAAVAAKR